LRMRHPISSPSGRAALGGMRDRAHGAERDGAAGHGKNFEQFQADDAVCASGPHSRRGRPAASGDGEHGERGSDRDGGGGCGRCRDRCRRREPGDRSSGRCGRRAARRDGAVPAARRFELVGPAPLRHDLHAVHVRQGQPDPIPGGSRSMYTPTPAATAPTASAPANIPRRARVSPPPPPGLSR